jgi:hypothetical protein
MPPLHEKPVQHSVSLVQDSGLMQHCPPAQTCPGGQHAVPQVVVFDGHWHWQVEALNTWLGPHVTHAPVAAHVFDPGGHAHLADAGSQNPLQHSELWRHLKPPFLQRPGAASARLAPTSDSMPPAAAVPTSLKACRRDVAA